MDDTTTDAGPGLQAGAWEVETTPALGTDLGGGFGSNYATCVERPLFAKALALRSGDTTVILLSVDILQMYAATIVDPAKKLITERTGIPASHVMVSATHTHSGPATYDYPGEPAVDPAYIDRVIEAIAEAAEGAVSVLRPARIGHGQADVSGICFNRRFHRTPDGQVEWNPALGRDDIADPAGPIDPTVTGLIVEERDGRPLAVWANLSLHYVGTTVSSAISSDYFGAFSERVRAWFGPHVRGQLTNGSSGDINNRDIHQAVKSSGKERADRVAEAVLGAVLAGAQLARRDDQVELRASLVQVEVERVAVTDDDIEIAREILAGERTDAPFSWVHGLPIPERLVPSYGRRHAGLVDTPERTTVPVQVITIGELCLVGLPGETFVEFALEIKAASPFAATAVIGLANDHPGYIPTLKAFSEGNYETWRDGNSWTAPGTGERLTAAAIEAVQALA